MRKQLMRSKSAITVTIDSKVLDVPYDLEFDFTPTTSSDTEIERAKEEVQRIGHRWIKDYLNDAVIISSTDAEAIEVLRATGCRIWYTSLAGKDTHSEPSIDNLTKEIFLAMAALFESDPSLQISKVTLYESETSLLICTKTTILPEEAGKWLSVHYDVLKQYVDDRNTTIHYS